MNSAPAQLLKAPARNWPWVVLLFVLPMLSCSMLESVPTTSPSADFHPTGQIVFECWPERTTSRLCLVNADGSEKRVITPTPVPMPDGISGNSPTWSPDKKHLTFWKIDKTTNEIVGLFIADQDGNNEKKLVDGLVSKAAWSPNGKKIAYAIYKSVSSNTYTSYIYVINSDGSGQQQLTSTYSNSPSWSPDGMKIAFTCGGICVMNADGSGSIVLKQNGLHPSWSPDGQYIVYYWSDPACGLCPTSGQLWVMRANGSQETRITDGPVDQNPAWGRVP